ncbi:MAG: DUF4388 domain-containing protein [Chloroherpetonaceae bacterium]|nr:DUF4388 domain-containing protein [Chloroherpetonaceae bacterium]MDW8438312.1 DUF4388 domain-containing protein [Chloroherpetonaceae bacterium]
MSVSGYFSDFSFAEVLRFLHASRKTGYLQTKPIVNGGHDISPSYHFWFRGGEIVAVQNPRTSLSNALIQICQKSREVASAFLTCADKTLSQPIGIMLKQHGVVEPEELQIAFNRQVLQPIAHHFLLDNAWFKFEVSTALPFKEMTGLSLSPIQAALNGLRRLKNWEPLKFKLPDPSSRLKRTSGSFIPYQLVSEEAYLWNLADGERSLSDLSSKLGLSVEETQRLAFRLIVTGFVEELPEIRSSGAFVLADDIGDENEPSALSGSFISNLLGFLKQRA